MHPSVQIVRRSGLALALLLGLLLPACASNQTGVVWKHDGWDGTLSIGEASYIVTRETQLYNAYGERIRLRDVPKVSDPDVGVRHLERAQVEFTTWEFAGETYLDTLWVLPARN
jgi:hypothetical protein